MDRLRSYIDPESFKELIEISLDYKWLLHYNVELAEIWNLFDEHEERELLKHLFSKFVFITSQDIREMAISIRQCILETWQLKSRNTFIVATSDDYEADGSQALLQCLKREFSGIDFWKERNFKNSIASIRDIQNNSNLVLLDDFIGTGKTANRRIKWVLDLNKADRKEASTIYFLAMAGMSKGIENINSIPLNRVFVQRELLKGITDLSPKGSVQKYITLMTQMEKKLGPKYNKKRIADFNFGYQRSEALYSVEAFTTPNNVFPVFWWPKLANGTNWRTLFKRL